MVTQEEVKAMIDRRDAMEKELEELLDILKLNNTNMTDPLTDQDGYPRADLDLYLIRQTRHDVNCLKNDLRDLMKRIESAMLELHGKQKRLSGDGGQSSLQEKVTGGQQLTSGQQQNCQPSPSLTTSNSTGEGAEWHRTSNEVFLRVDKVEPNSPASISGLQSKDEIIQFGSLCADNFKDLHQLAEVVRLGVDKPLRVTVLRDMRPFRLTLTPKKWQGSSLLGCTVIPVKPSGSIYNK